MQENKDLFEALRDFSQSGEIASVDAALKSRSFIAAGGIKYYDYLKGTKVSEKKRDEVIAKLSHYLCCRRMIEHGPEIIEAAYTGDYEEATGKVSGMMDDLSKSIKHEHKGSHIRECLSEVIADMSEMQSSGKSICKPMGLPSLDNMTGGLITELILIAGPTSSGKSALANQYILANCLEHKRPGIIFSYEMDKKTVTKRMVANRSGVSLSKLMGVSPDGSVIKFRKDELLAVQREVKELADTQLYIEDDVNLTVEDIWARSVEIKALQGDIGVVVVDYLQICSPSRQTAKENRERQISHMGIKLKQLSQHLHCPVIALSQLGPDFGTRESRALEQHAGVLLKVLRGEDRAGQRITDEKIEIWKSRNSARFVDVPIFFDGDRQRFSER